MVGLYIPCVGRMAAKGVIYVFFVILSCFRKVRGKFSSGTSLNKHVEAHHVPSPL